MAESAECGQTVRIRVDDSDDSIETKKEGNHLCSSQVAVQSFVSWFDPNSIVNYPDIIDKLISHPQCVRENTVNDLVTELLLLTDVGDASEIEVILEKEVPHIVNKRCSEVLKILTDILNETRQNCTQNFLDENQMVTTEFYEHLKKCTDKMGQLPEDEEESSNSKGNYTDLIRALYRVSLGCLNPGTGKNDLHSRWNAFMVKILLLMTGSAKKYNNEIVQACFMTTGHAVLSFLCSDGAGYGTNVSCSPDGRVDIIQEFILSSGGRIVVDFPALCLEVKSMYAHTSTGYVPGFKKGTSSSTSNSEQNTDCGMSSSSGHASSLKKSLRKASPAAYSKMKSSKKMKNDESDYCLEEAERKQMDHLKVQHMLQLIAVMKETIKTQFDTERKAAKNNIHISFSDTIPSAFGMFLLQNRLYLTKLSVIPTNPVETKRNVYRQEFVARNLGLKEYSAWAPTAKDFTLQYEMPNGYLDIFNPVHIEALLIYLRIIIFHEQKYKLKTIK